MSKTLGLDLGIASVGYAVVNITEDSDVNSGEIIKAGVRTFPVAEHPKDGASLALPRRAARSVRRIIHRKAQRISAIKKLFSDAGLLSEEQIKNLNITVSPSPWEIRKNALSSLADNQDFARALLHIAKRRGFKSMRKSQEENDKETGKLLQGIKEIQNIFAENKYQTIGEMFASAPLNQPKRNKDGSYKNSVARKMLEEEVSVLFEKQRQFGNKQASADLENKFKEIAFYQRPLQSMANMVGYCPFEPKEKRAPKNSYTAEVFSALSRINNIRLIDLGKEEPLSSAQKKQALDLCFMHLNNNFAQLRKVLNLPDNITFNISYAVPKGKEPKGYEPEKKTKIFAMNGFHQVRKAVGDDSAVWEKLIYDEQSLNSIAEVLSVYKSDEQIVENLKAKGINQDIADKVKNLSFSGFMHLSIKAMKKIIPFLEKGLKYNEACAAAGYDFKMQLSNNKKYVKVPPLDNDDNSITNPVVKRSISQTIKVVNALNREYGPFDSVNIELAREMGKSFSDRKDIESKQKAGAEERAEIKANGIEGIFPKSSTDIKKIRLWKQQGGFCIYSGKYIQPGQLLEDGYTQIDHIIPYSISFDSCFNNLVLCLAAENQNKKNDIPFDYFKRIGRDWNHFEVSVTNSVLPYQKKLRLLKNTLTDADISGFKERNLNDTKYISSFIKNYLEQNLALSGVYKNGIFCRNGRLTADLRGWWGLSKERGESDRHHALDAVVLACSTNSVMNRVSKAYKDGKELSAKHDKNYVPQPWTNFRTDVFKALSNIFVSRPPRKKVSGALHEDTYFSSKYLKKGFTVHKDSVEKLTLESLQKQRELEIKYFGAERNKQMYDAIENALKARKDSKDPLNVSFNGIPVKKVRLIRDSFSGVPVLKGKALAANGAMPRVDIFKKDGRYYCVPLYTIDFAKTSLPLTSKPEGIEMSAKDFVFSVFKDEYLEITNKKGEVFEGYFSQYRASSSQICLESADKAKTFVVNGMPCSNKDIRITTLVDMKKYQIDILGGKHLIRQEKYVGNIKKRKCFGGN